MKKKIIYFLLMSLSGLHATDTNKAPIDSALKEQCTQIMQEMLQNMLSGLQHGHSTPQQEAESNSEREIGDDLEQLVVISTPDESEIARGVAATAPFTISASVFGGANRFFVGPDAATPNQTLSRAVLTPPSSGPGVVNFVPMVSPATLNGAAGTPSPIAHQPVALITLAGENPSIQGKQSPATVLAGDTLGLDLYYLIADDGSLILEHENAILDAAGNPITKQIVQIAGTLGPQPLLFAAVSDATHSVMPTTQAWGDPVGVDRGIAVLQPDQSLDSNPQGLDVVDQAPHNGATKLDLTDGGPVSFGSTASITNKVAMYWDDPLQCLYIGLSGVTRGDVNGQPVTNVSEGVTPVIVGTLDDSAQLTFAPITQMLSQDLFNDSSDPTQVTDILGFYRRAGQSDPFSASALNLGVMHSSTGRDYLIMNGGVDTANPATPAALNTQVYAIPLVPSGSGAATGFAGQTNEDGPFVVVDDVDNMPQSNQLQTTVGQDPKLLSFDMTLPIQHMQVSGDTVYISVARIRDDAHTGEAGIFSSTALFSPNGIIRDWTPWKREMGRAWAVNGFGFDTQTSNFWLATTGSSTPGNANQVLVTQWGLGDAELHTTTVGSTPVMSTLQTQIEATFGDRGGVYGLFNFDSGTNGFAVQNPHAALIHQNQRSPQFSMMVATGNSSVMLVQTGNFSSTSGTFVPTGAYISPASSTTPSSVNVYSYTGQTSPALQQLGTITSAEVSRLPLSDFNPNTGWLFVGGTLGLAVFADVFEGDGWPTASAMGTGGLNQLRDGTGPDDFAVSKSFQFLQLLCTQPDGSLINPFTDVRRIVSDQNKYLYVLTVDTLYRFEMTQNNFKQTANNTFVAAINNCTIVATIQDLASRIPEFNATHDQFFDLMVIERDTANLETVVLLGTSKGLYKNTSILDDNLAGEDFKAIIWRPIRPSDGVDLGPTLQFDFISRNMGNQFSSTENNVNYANGNLRVLALDKKLKSLAYYRFDVNFNTVLETVTVDPFSEPYEDLSNVQTPYFFKLGTFDSALAAEFIGQRDFFVRTRDVFGVESGFANNVPVVPNPSTFLPHNNIYPEIDLRLVLKLPFIATPMVHDTASGSRYVAGEFGVRVNE